MSIRDIIEAARDPLPPTHDPAFRDAMNARRAFDRLFRDPEHVALMEAERVAAREFITDRASGLGFAVAKYDRYIDACEATDAYRKERGL